MEIDLDRSRRLRSLFPATLLGLLVGCGGGPVSESGLGVVNDDRRISPEAVAENLDPGKRAEHQALRRLLPDDALATHVASESGSWFDRDTWADGEVPGEGAIVRIPSSIAVTYEGGSAEHLFVVRVDGGLKITASNGRQTRMVVDTLFCTPGSELALAASDTASSRLEIEIRPFDIQDHEASGAPGWGVAAIDHYSDGAPVTDTGAGTRKPEDHTTLGDGAGVLGRWQWDPLQLSLGLVSHGAVRMAGREKTGRIAIAGPARAGDRSILLSERPTGWAGGDVVVITTARYVGRDPLTGAYVGSEDEIREIVDVKGETVTLDRPLEFDHVPPRGGLTTYAANLTRNIVIRSSIDQPLEDLDADRIGRLASTLGHVMFMHIEDVRVSYVAFDDLGRTDKTEAADDHLRWGYDGSFASRRRVKETGRYARTRPDRLTNPRGRYAVHMHRAGATSSDATALIEGSVVTGGPGWGFVSHDSRVDFLDNVTYGVLGAGFVAETGNEAGTWEGNTAINTYGAAYNSRLLDAHSPRYVDGDFEEVVLLEKRGAWKSHDFGHYGNGFWLQGKLIDMRRNVSVSSGLWGYFFMFRGPDQTNVDPGLLQEPLSVHSPRGIHPSAPGLNVFVENESIADRGGLIMIGLGGGRTSDERTVVDRFTAWEVGQTGTRAQYYPVYTITESTFIASASPGANPREGVLLDKVQVDTVLAHLRIEGFPRQYNLRKYWSPGAENQHGFDEPYAVIERAHSRGGPNPLPLGYAHVVIDGGFSRQEATEERFLGSTYREEDTILSSDELELGRFDIVFDDASLKIDLDNTKIVYGTLPNDPIRPTLPEGHVLLLKGIKRDSIGEIPIDYLNNVLVWHPDAVRHRLETDGYYRMPNGSLGVILEELFTDRYTAEKHLVRFVAELDPRWDLTGTIDRGRFDPEDHRDVYVPRFLVQG